MNVKLMQKEYNCPICKARFKAPRPRMAKLNLIGVDNDFRPYYEGVDIVCYDVIVCSSCGYTAMEGSVTNFDPLYVERMKRGIDKVSPQRVFLTQVLLEDAIERYLYALSLLEYKKTSFSEYYFLFLRLAWAYRSINSEEAIENEYLATKKALENLENAYKNSEMPIYGMDESTTIFMLAELSRRVGEYEKANLYIGKSILDPKSNDELRTRAKDTKVLIQRDIDKSVKIMEANKKAELEAIEAINTAKAKIKSKKKEKKPKVKKTKESKVKPKNVSEFDI